MSNLYDTLLHHVTENKRDELAALLSTTSDVDLFLLDKPILHYSLKNPEIFQLLINRKFDLTIDACIDNYCGTVLQLALHNDLCSFAQIIMKKHDTKSLYKDLDTFVYNEKQYHVPKVSITDIAIKYNLLDILVMCYDSLQNISFEFSGKSFTYTHMDLAAEYGHLDILKWLHTHSNAGCTCDAMNKAAENGHLDTVKWLDEKHNKCTTEAINNAAKNGHLDIVKWLFENRAEGCTNLALANACNNNHVDIVVYLLSKMKCTIYDIKSVIRTTTNNDIKDILIETLNKKL